MPTPPETRRPNIVVFQCDDLDFDGVECFDSLAFPSLSAEIFARTGRVPLERRVITPRIADLARKGAVFTRFYATSPVCSPSRYSLFTGRYASTGRGFLRDCPPGSHANIKWNTPILTEDCTLPKVLRTLGYQTAMVGKWHTYSTIDEVKDWGKLPAEAPAEDPSLNRLAGELHERCCEEIRACGFDFVDRVNLGNTELLPPEALRYFNLEWHTEGALHFLDSSGPEPFFLYYGIPAPHGELISTQHPAFQPKATTAGTLEQLPEVQPDRASTIRRVREAGLDDRASMALWIDDAVGVVLDQLEALGKLDNTLVLFTTDHQTRGKFTCYEGGRVPCVISWPGRIPAGRRVENLCANIDLPATLIEAAGGTIPSEMNAGFSLWPLLTGASSPEEWRRSLLLEISNIRAVVTADYKYIANRLPKNMQALMDEDQRQAEAEGRLRYVGWEGTSNPHSYKETEGIRYGVQKHFPDYFDPDQLYDLQADFLEQKNLAALPEFAEVRREMESLLQDHLLRMPHPFGEFGGC